MPKRISLLSCVICAAMLLFLSENSTATPDAISAASLQVSTASATTTSVTLSYTFKHGDGSRKLCYALAPQVPSTNCITKTPNAKTAQIQVTGLQAGSTYNFILSAIDTKGKHRTSVTEGTFATAKGDVTSLRPGLPSRPSLRKTENVDALGRAFEAPIHDAVRKQYHVQP